MTTTFDQLCTKHFCDKGNWAHRYSPHYEWLLEPFKDKPIRLLEIGVGDGKSIRVWLEYFTHPHVQIIGVDKDPVMTSYDRFTFVQADQTSPLALQALLDGPYDIIIDDGCHNTQGIMTSFETLWPFVKPGGFYVIEDLRCSYMPGYEIPGWPSQMYFIKQLLDDINSQTNYKPAPDTVCNYPNGTDSGRRIDWLRFSEELAIIKKK